MAGNEIEVLDANIVVLPAAPLTQLAKVPALFESDELKSLLKTVTGSQGLQIDAASGSTALMLAFESMRSQRIVNVGINRIEVHDRSGNREFDAEALAQIIDYLVRQLEVNITTVGANFNVTFPIPSGQNAARTIATVLFTERKDYVLDNMERVGGAGRLFLERSDGVQYSIVIEPRLQSLDTTSLFLASNANLVAKEMPSMETLVHLVRDNCRVVEHVARTLFSVSW